MRSKGIVFCVIVWSVAQFVRADAYSWLLSTGTGSFQTPANWTPTGLPAASDSVTFGTAGSYDVSFAADVQNTGATVGSSSGTDVTFDLGGFSWVLSSLAFSGTATARCDGGALTIENTVLAGANQKLVLDGGSCWFKGAQLGTSSGGTIEVNGGDHVVAWAMPLNPPPTGGASFRMTGGSVSLTNNNNSARCTLSNGSKISLEGGTLSVRYQVDVNGSSANPAVIDIYTNAMLLQNPGIGFNVSRSVGGLGIVNILGGSFVLSNSNCNVGNVWNSPPTGPTGIVNLVDGTMCVGTLSLGYSSNAVAYVNQSGGQMQVTISTLVGGERDTVGVLTQEGGSSWHKQLYVGAFSSGGNCEGDVFLSGGTMAVASGGCGVGRYAGSTGRLLQTGGDLLISNSVSVGNASGAVGVVTNTGGSLWLNGTLYVGSSGSSSAGAWGRAYFAGPSNWVNSGIVVGNSGADTGELAVAGGRLIVPNGSLLIGNAIGAVGRAEISDGICAFRGLTVGSYGSGTLYITGGQLSMTNGSAMMVADASNAVGRVVISGGTNILSGANTTVGQHGIGSMRVEGGYTYTTNRFMVGGGSNGVGRLELVGGVLAAPIIDGRDPTLTNGNPGGYSEVLFDGGTFQHSVDGEPWMPGSIVSTFAKATLTDRGAVIDSNGGTVGIGQTLINGDGYAGSFTKKGEGKLTLSSLYNTFTGRVAVEKGELIVSGVIYLCGGVAIDAGAVLNLGSAGAVYGLTTASGTVSRVDGTLVLKTGTVLTNGVGATFCGSGVVTGSVVFASGSAWALDKSAYAGPLNVTGSMLFADGATVKLTGYTADELATGIVLAQTSDSVTLLPSGLLPVTLDGASHPDWLAKVSNDGRTLTARVIPRGTIFLLL